VRLSPNRDLFPEVNALETDSRGSGGGTAGAEGVRARHRHGERRLLMDGMGYQVCVNYRRNHALNGETDG
jgi:hypothetical protein